MYYKTPTFSHNQKLFFHIRISTSNIVHLTPNCDICSVQHSNPSLTWCDDVWLSLRARSCRVLIDVSVHVDRSDVISVPRSAIPAGHAPLKCRRHQSVLGVINFLIHTTPHHFSNLFQFSICACWKRARTATAILAFARRGAQCTNARTAANDLLPMDVFIWVLLARRCGGGSGGMLLAGWREHIQTEIHSRIHVRRACLPARRTSSRR